MRSPRDMDIIQIDISNKCGLKCSNCTRLIAHQPKREDMALENFERAVKSMEGWNAPNRVLGVIGGEPTLHPDFERISRRFAELWGGPATANGREPIADINAFATQRLFDRSNGRGLWTSLGEGFYRHYETIMDVYGHWNTNTHETAGRHQALLITREDYQAQTGMSDEQWQSNRDDCWVQRMWSGTINDRGAYFCEVAGSIDRLLFEGRHAWPVEQGWWERTPADFGAQLNLCNYCGLAQPGPSQLDSLERDIISKQHHALLSKAGSPAIRKGQFEIYDPAYHNEKRVVATQDSYVGEGRRVGPGNMSVLPRHLSGVVVSVNYGNVLAQTLPENIHLFDEFVVVTTHEDTETQDIARKYGAKLVLSNRCYDDDHVFNKGRMLNDGLAALERPDWVVFTDADVFINAGLRAFVLNHALNPGCLYYTRRRELGSVENQPTWMNAQPNGYFQLFNPKAAAIRERWPKLVSENFCSAGSVDSWFNQQWPGNKMVAVDEIGVTHLSSDSYTQNWNGKKSLIGKWVQFGIYTSLQGFTAIMPLNGLPPELKLTDTLYGESITIKENTIGEHLYLGPAGLYFEGKELGWRHIHVACRLTEDLIPTETA